MSMSSKVNKGWLILITIVFILIAGLLVYFSVIYPILKEKGIIVPSSNDSQGVINADFTPVADSEFKTDNLEFSATFSNLSIPSEIKNAPMNTIIESIESGDSSVTVILQQAQKCTTNNKIKTNEGKYWYDGSILVLSALQKDTEGEFTEDCVVSLSFKVKSFTLPDQENYNIGFQATDQSTVIFSTCFYGKKLYYTDDVFVAADGCNTCTCTDGEISCTEKEECSIESVYKGDENYSRYESEDKAGECSGDLGCYVGGCSSEVCSAQEGINTTCDVVETIPAVCKCIRSTCLWVEE